MIRQVAGQPAGRVKGFSLIELVISMAILTVGIVGAMRVFPVGLRASRRSEMSSRAAITAQRVIESLKLKPWEALADGITTASEDGFEIATTIAPAPVTGLVDPSQLKRVDVQVHWVQDARPRELVFSTYLRRESS